MLAPLRPRALTLFNRWLRRPRGAPAMRDLVILLLAAALCYILFRGTSIIAVRFQQINNLAYLPPTVPLAFVALTMFVLTFFSAATTALGSLYLADDIELLLSSPISGPRFFISKLIEVAIASSWMGLLFGVPVVAGFGAAYAANYEYYLGALIAFVLLMLIPSAVAMLCVTAIARVLPLRRTRELLLAITLLVIVGSYLLSRRMVYASSELRSIDDVMRLVTYLELPLSSWLPSYWCAAAIGEYLSASGRGATAYLSMLLLAAVMSTSAAYIVISAFHRGAYSLGRSASAALQLPSRRSQRAARMLLWRMNPQWRAVLIKELKVFSRDISQTMQLFLLLALCLVYLYNFKVLRGIETIPQFIVPWWEVLLSLLNILMGSLVIGAIAARFVFPSISSEGRAFWVIQSGPISPSSFLTAKLICWYPPIAISALVIFVSGALALQAPPTLLVITAAAALLISFGHVALAIGMGAKYADFNAQYAAQLASGGGSLAFMLSGAGLTAASLVPCLVMALLQSVAPGSFAYTTAATVCALLVLLMLQLIIWRRARIAGVSALARS